ncbi:MAG TPA: hypothetical protein VLM40_23360, partial [Gemmata sp.]|nr:hypothetical protein [Gemmata sp.]
MNHIQRTCSVGFFLLTIFVGAGLCRADDADEWDATYVTMIVPKTVEADQTFAVAITMKKTGTRTWQFGEGNTPATLRSQSPEENETWGTKYIIQGQGTKVAPGQQFTFKSNLRAPSEVGNHVFQWRLSGKQGLFGETTAKLEINVVARKEAAAKPPAIPAADADGKRPLTFNDFEYLGSFRVPVKVGKGGAGFSESGLALRKLTDGSRRLILNYTHPAQELFEVEIPRLVKFENDNAKALQTAAVKRQWGRIGNNSKEGPNDKIQKERPNDKKQTKGPNDVKQWGANGGFCWDEERNTL